MSADSLIVSADAIRKTTDKKGLLMAQKEQKKWENLDFLVLLSGKLPNGTRKLPEAL